MGSRLATTITANNEMSVRLLVPCKRASGEIVYQVETRRIRLPLRRADRLLFQQRLSALRD